MRVPFNPAEDLVTFAVTLHGPGGSGIARLALDTAASQTTFSRRALLAVGIDPDRQDRERVRVIAASGIISIPLVPLDKLDALGQQRDDFTVLAHTLPKQLTVDGVLGLDFIRAYRLVVDFRTGRISLT